MFRKQSKRQLSEQVIRFLLARYARGEVSWNEEKLTRQFQVSRTPIRDALHELEKQGIIVRRQKTGIILRKPSVKEISEIYDIRIALEKLAIEQAVKIVTPKDIQDLKKIAHDIDRAVRNKDVLLTDQMDTKFHTKLIEISGNHYLKTIVDQFDLLIRAFQLSSRLVISPELLQAPGHEEIIEAIGRRDKRMCLNLIQKHINDTKKSLLEQASS